jgi:hypothetical protein
MAALQRTYLFPRTATVPIRLSQYLERNKLERMSDEARLNPDYIAWHDRMVSKGKDHDDYS